MSRWLNNRSVGAKLASNAIVIVLGLAARRDGGFGRVQKPNANRIAWRNCRRWSRSQVAMPPRLAPRL